MIKLFLYIRNENKLRARQHPFSFRKFRSPPRDWVPRNARILSRRKNREVVIDVAVMAVPCS